MRELRGIYRLRGLTDIVAYDIGTIYERYLGRGSGRAEAVVHTGRKVPGVIMSCCCMPRRGAKRQGVLLILCLVAAPGCVRFHSIASS